MKSICKAQWWEETQIPGSLKQVSVEENKEGQNVGWRGAGTRLCRALSETNLEKLN